MLILERHPSESIQIDTDMTLTVLRVKIVRTELLEKA